MKEKERMEKDVSNHKLLSVNQLMSNGIVFENRDQFEQSIFADVYKRAEELISQIIKDNCSWRKNKKQEFKSSNVISFIGRRGTGKTSAMCSFAQVLKEPKESDCVESIQFEYENKNGNISFHVLERIDASTLEASEDMFLLILANMFTKLLNREEQKSGMIQGYEKRVLFEKFERIFEDFKALDERTDMSGYSIFEQLKNMASSQRIRETFKELVDLYLDEMMECDGRQSDSYLVVLIDDLDMAKQKREQKLWNWGSYKIMSSIYKYLTVPRVIVLTAYNAENLYSQCINYYKVQYEGSLARYESLASQFMEKVFPIYTRLYMPSWKKMDIDTKGKVRIKIDDYEDNRMHQIQKEKNGHLTIREFILILLAEKTGIYFNLNGEKSHYLEPDTLRTLFNVTVLINGLKPYNTEKLEDEKEYDKFLFNLDILKKDCLFRFASDQLSDTTPTTFEYSKLSDIESQKLEDVRRSKFAGGFEYGMFHELQSLPITLRSKEIVEWVLPQITPLDRLERGMRKNGLWRNFRVTYSYAELVYCIYAMKTKAAELSPEFGNCVLYSYTLHMTELYEKYLHYKRKVSEKEYMLSNRNAEELETHEWNEVTENINMMMAKQYYNELKEIMGTGILGKWSQYYFPQIRFSLGKDLREKRYRIGYVEDVRLKYLVDLDITEPVDEMHKIMLVDYIKSFLFASMMHTNALKWNQDNFKCSWISANENLKLQLAFVERLGSDDFDITMPIFYMFCYAEYLNKFEYEIQRAVERLIEKEGDKTKDGVKDCIRKNLKEAFSEIWKEYYAWDKKFGNMMLPVYNLDVMYNMMIFVYEDCREEASVEMTMEDSGKKIFEQYLRMLDRFSDYLDLNDKNFGLNLKEGYYEVLINSPIYRLVRDLKKTEKNIQNNAVKLVMLETKEKIAHYIMSIVQYLATEKETEQSPD